MLEDFYMWRDVERNKTFVKYGTEIIEVPWVIVEAYRQQEESSFDLYKAVSKRSDMLTTENAKLRELVVDMWCSAIENCHFAERLSFADEFVERMRELKIEVINNA